MYHLCGGEGGGPAVEGAVGCVERGLGEGLEAGEEDGEQRGHGRVRARGRVLGPLMNNVMQRYEDCLCFNK